MHIRKLEDEEPVPYSLLLEADPSIEQVNSYLDRNYTYIAETNKQIIAVIALYPIDSKTIEIKNLSVDNNHQRKGIGSMLIKYAESASKNMGYRRTIIGTADISISPIPLYQKVGYKIYSVKNNFFVDNYPEPIYDHGEQCIDMVMLEKEL